MTQSAASQTVQNIEEFLSVQLIDRTKRPFVLTSEGQRFFDGLSSILRQFDSLVNEVRQTGDEVNGHVTIASIYSVGLSYLPPIEEAFEAKFSGSTHSIQLAHPHEVYRLVEQGNVDFGLTSYPEASKTLQATHWRDEKMVLVASPRHRLATGEPVTPAALNQCGLVAFASNLRIRQEIDRHLRAMGITMRVVVELDNIDSVKHAVMVNSGVAFVPEPTVTSEIASGALQVIECPGLSFTRALGIVQRRHVALSRPARAFLDLILQDANLAVPSDSNGKASKGTEKAGVGSPGL